MAELIGNVLKVSRKHRAVTGDSQYGIRAVRASW